MSAFRRMGIAEAQVSSHNAWGQPVLKMLWSCVSLVCKERQEPKSMGTADAQVSSHNACGQPS